MEVVNDWFFFFWEGRQLWVILAFTYIDIWQGRATGLIYILEFHERAEAPEYAMQ